MDSIFQLCQRSLLQRLLDLTHSMDYMDKEIITQRQVSFKWNYEELPTNQFYSGLIAQNQPQ